MSEEQNEFNPDNCIHCPPGSPIDSYFEGALQENGIRYFKKTDNEFGSTWNAYDEDCYYFTDDDFQKVKTIYDELDKAVGKKNPEHLTDPLLEEDNEVRKRRLNRAQNYFFLGLVLLLALVALYFSFFRNHTN